ncbi:hypothetical protein L207DRAFT_585486 [Hyaloscypha variabilis F]|uniref:Uncharacterized protein n=1 Tax=Hyaloscypha variabilis (strain UAMH 11265 / GT02V1 / F) TaxID=1149755 RepID=A0A2J6RF37_HYAVF|nr:hypothetical protein L207DRAFT_585486 [Hyaloscypha variabilis F]
MPAKWKNTVVRALDCEHLSFPDERELIRPLIENESANGDPIPCLYHLRALADRLYMVSDLDIATLADHFSIVWNESTKETDWIRLISHKDTRDLFKNNATFEGIRSRVSLNTMRFAPLLSQAQTYDMAAVIARIGLGVHFLQGPAGSLRE